MKSQPEDPGPKPAGDPRVDGLVTVGWVTLAALGISIPLTGIIAGYSGWMAPLLPFGILIGSGLMAMRIWSSGERQVNREANEALAARIQELEERLANLEMVDSLEAHFAERHRSASPSSGASGEVPTMGPSLEEP